MYFHRYRRRIYGKLPFLERLLRTGGHPNNLPGTNRQNTGIQTPRLARRHHNSNQRNNRETQVRSKRNNEKIRLSKIQAISEEMRIFQERG